MRPPPRARMCGTQSRTQRIAPKSLSSRSACQAASSTASNPRAAEVLPALLRASHGVVVAREDAGRDEHVVADL